MIQRYFTEPYRFVPPHQGKFWCRLFDSFVPMYLRRVMKVGRCRYSGLEYLRDSLAQSKGVLLASNHSCWPDPVVLANLGLQSSTFFYYIVSYHLFQQSRFMGWLTNRLGGYSVLREGADRESIRVTSQLLAEGDRPIVLFPEGTWFRQNDRLGPMQKGITLIARQAARHSTKPLVVHPVAIKYWLLADPTPAIRARLAQLESRCGRPVSRAPFVDRIRGLYDSLVDRAEVRFKLKAPPSTLDERLARISDARVAQLENLYFDRNHEGTLLERIRRLRHRLVGKLRDVQEADRVELQHVLDDLLFCENLAAHSWQYLVEMPSFERLTETVMRLEETLLDQPEKALAPLGASVELGPAIDLRSNELQTDMDALVPMLGSAIQNNLDRLLLQGPPSDWPHPARSAQADIHSLK